MTEVLIAVGLVILQSVALLVALLIVIAFLLLAGNVESEHRDVGYARDARPRLPCQPQVRSVDDLAGLTIGVQQGNTSQPIADRLVADGKAAAVRVYDYGDIRTALADLTTGGCDAFMKLAPVLTELVKPVAGVEVVQRGITTERIAIAVATTDAALLARINAAQVQLEENETLPGIRQRWTGSPRLDQSGM